MNVNLPEEFSARLRDERKRLDMNQTEFAKAAGVHLNSQSRYEKGERAPDTAYLGAIAQIGVDMRFLLTGERGDDLQGELSAAKHLLNEMQGFLDLCKPPLSFELEKAMREAHLAQKTAWSDPDELERVDRNLHLILSKSAEILPTVAHLEEILLRLELVETRLGLVLPLHAKAQCIRRVYQEDKRAGRHLGLDEVERIARDEVPR